MIRVPLFLVLVSLLGTTACSPTVRKPRLLHPGSAGFQRYNATQFDPYPLNDVAPEIAGGRPLDFTKPTSEVTRARQHRPVGPWRSAPAY